MVIPRTECTIRPSYMSGRMGFDILKGTSCTLTSAVLCTVIWLASLHIMDVSCFAKKQEWAEAVLKQNGNFKHLFERDVRYFGKNQLYCMEAIMVKHYVVTPITQFWKNGSYAVLKLSSPYRASQREVSNSMEYFKLFRNNKNKDKYLIW